MIERLDTVMKHEFSAQRLFMQVLAESEMEQEKAIGLDWITHKNSIIVPKLAPIRSQPLHDPWFSFKYIII